MEKEKTGAAAPETTTKEKTVAQLKKELLEANKRADKAEGERNELSELLANKEEAEENGAQLVFISGKKKYMLKTGSFILPESLAKEINEKPGKRTAEDVRENQALQDLLVKHELGFIEPVAKK